MPSHKHKFYFCLWCLWPAHSPHCHPQRAIHHMEAAVATASSFPGWAERCFLLVFLPPSGSGSYVNIKSSSTFSPKSCQDISKVKCIHLSIDCKPQYSPSLSCPSRFENSCHERKENSQTPLSFSVIHFVPYIIPFIFYFGDNSW